MRVSNVYVSLFFLSKGGKPVGEFLREAKALGVAMRCCSGSLQARGIAPGDLIPECDGLVGGATMIELGLTADLVLSY